MYVPHLCSYLTRILPRHVNITFRRILLLFQLHRGRGPKLFGVLVIKVCLLTTKRSTKVLKSQVIVFLLRPLTYFLQKCSTFNLLFAPVTCMYRDGKLDVAEHAERHITQQSTRVPWCVSE